MSVALIKYYIGHKLYLEPHKKLARKRDKSGRGNAPSKEVTTLARKTLDPQEDKLNIEKDIITLKRYYIWNYLLIFLYSICTIVVYIDADHSGKEMHYAQRWSSVSVMMWCTYSTCRYYDT